MLTDCDQSLHATRCVLKGMSTCAAINQPATQRLNVADMQDDAFRRKRYEIPSRLDGKDRMRNAMTPAERTQRQRQRQESTGPDAGRRAASAYAMLRKSRESRQQTSEGAGRTASDGTSAAQ